MSPSLPLLTPTGDSSSHPTSIEAELLAQIEALRQDMTKIQKHNNIFSSKVDETQQQLNQQQTYNIQIDQSSESL